MTSLLALCAQRLWSGLVSLHCMLGDLTAQPQRCLQRRLQWINGCISHCCQSLKLQKSQKTKKFGSVGLKRYTACLVYTSTSHCGLEMGDLC